ncbi:MAG: hypothetical protein ACI9K9_000305, partial [Neolewinella sp.]
FGKGTTPLPQNKSATPLIRGAAHFYKTLLFRDNFNS